MLRLLLSLSFFVVTLVDAVVKATLKSLLRKVLPSCSGIHFKMEEIYNIVFVVCVVLATVVDVMA